MPTYTKTAGSNAYTDAEIADAVTALEAYADAAESDANAYTDSELADASVALTDGHEFTGTIGVTSAAPQLAAQSFGATSEVRGRVAAGTSGSPTAATTSNTTSLAHYGWDGSAYSLGGALTIAPTQTYSGSVRGTQAALTLTPTGSTTPATVFTFNSDATLSVATRTKQIVCSPFFGQVADTSWTVTSDAISVDMAVDTTGTVIFPLYALPVGGIVTTIVVDIGGGTFAANNGVVTVYLYRQAFQGALTNAGSGAITITTGQPSTTISHTVLADNTYFVAIEVTQPGTPSTGAFTIKTLKVTVTDTSLGAITT